MTNIALLNNIDHHDVKIALGDQAAFGAEVNQALIFPTEIEDAQRDYPIVLRRNDEGGYYPVLLLGLDRDENLFLDGQGWGGRYIPAVLQRGPFRIGVPEPTAGGDERADPKIHIDLDHPTVNRSTGEPLFLEHGGNAPYLDHIARVLRRIHEGGAVEKPMFAAFAGCDLIEPIALRITLDETTRYDVPDCFTIGPQRLATLDGTVLERLNRTGFLRLAFMISASLGNVSRLIERKNARRTAGMPK